MVLIVASCALEWEPALCVEARLRTCAGGALGYALRAAGHEVAGLRGLGVLWTVLLLAGLAWPFASAGMWPSAG